MPFNITQFISQRFTSCKQAPIATPKQKTSGLAVRNFLLLSTVLVSAHMQAQGSLWKGLTFTAFAAGLGALGNFGYRKVQGRYRSSPPEKKIETFLRATSYAMGFFGAAALGTGIGNCWVHAPQFLQSLKARNVRAAISSYGELAKSFGYQLPLAYVLIKQAGQLEQQRGKLDEWCRAMMQSWEKSQSNDSYSRAYQLASCHPDFRALALARFPFDHMPSNLFRRYYQAAIPQMTDAELTHLLERTSRERLPWKALMNALTLEQLQTVVTPKIVKLFEDVNLKELPTKIDKLVYNLTELETQAEIKPENYEILNKAFLDLRHKVSLLYKEYDSLFSYHASADRKGNNPQELSFLQTLDNLIMPIDNNPLPRAFNFLCKEKKNRDDKEGIATRLQAVHRKLPVRKLSITAFERLLQEDFKDLTALCRWLKISSQDVDTISEALKIRGLASEADLTLNGILDANGSLIQERLKAFLMKREPVGMQETVSEWLAWSPANLKQTHPRTFSKIEKMQAVLIKVDYYVSFSFFYALKLGMAGWEISSALLPGAAGFILGSLFPRPFQERERQKRLERGASSMKYEAEKFAKASLLGRARFLHQAAFVIWAHRMASTINGFRVGLNLSDEASFHWNYFRAHKKLGS